MYCERERGVVLQQHTTLCSMFVPSKWNDIAHGLWERFFLLLFLPNHTPQQRHIFRWAEARAFHMAFCAFGSLTFFFSPTTIGLFFLFVLSFTRFKWQMDCLYVRWIAPVAEATCDWIMFCRCICEPESRALWFQVYSHREYREYIHCGRLQPEKEAKII